MSARPDPLLDARANPRLLSAIRVAIGVYAFARGLGLIVVAWPTLNAVHVAAIFAWLVLAAMVIIGWRARPAAAALAGLWFLLLLYDAGVFYANHSYLIAVCLLLVSFSDCERHYSLRPRGRGDAPGWPLALMRIQVSVVYGYAGLAKVNEQFFSGEVLAHYMDRAVLPFVSGLAASPLLVLMALSLSVVALELYIAAAVWSRRLRPSAFALAVPLHIGMAAFSGPWLTFYEIVVFSLVMFTLLTAFVQLPAQGRLVVWDDSCSFCRRWVATFRRLDAYGALRFVGSSSDVAYDGTGVTPESAAEAMQLVEPDGTIRSGWWAVQGIVATLPGGHLLAPYMSLPIVRQLGQRAYRRVAASRTCAYGPPLATAQDGPA